MEAAGAPQPPGRAALRGARVDTAVLLRLGSTATASVGDLPSGSTRPPPSWVEDAALLQTRQIHVLDVAIGGWGQRRAKGLWLCWVGAVCLVQ